MTTRSLIKYIVLALLCSLAFVNIAQAQSSVSKQFSFENFDGTDVTIDLNIEQSFIDASIVNWYDLITKPRGNSNTNYFNLIEAHFENNRESFKFVFDMFDGTLPHVDDEYFINTVIRFIQSMPYQVPPLEYKGAKTSGLLAPILSLAEGWGDCDTKSLLLICVLAHRYEMLFLAGAKHAFIGIKANPGIGQEYVEIKGEKYVLCEMTSKWRLGELPASSVKDISLGQYKYRVFKY